MTENKIAVVVFEQSSLTEQGDTAQNCSSNDFKNEIEFCKTQSNNKTYQHHRQKILAPSPSEIVWREAMDGSENQKSFLKLPEMKIKFKRKKEKYKITTEEESLLLNDKVSPEICS